MTKTCILYCRVSTDEQADSGYSLPSQMEVCRKYAEGLGYTVVGNRWYDLDAKKQVGAPNEHTFPVPVYADDFTGTVPIEQRPEGKYAFDTLRGNRADCMFAYRMDRLVRPPEDGDEWDIAILIRSLGKLGKEIWTVQRGRIGTDFASLLIAVLDARGSGEERRKILENTKRGKDTKAREGKVVGGGNAPYGYRYANTRQDRAVDALVVYEPEAKVVRLIFEWYTNGDGGLPLGTVAIADKLTEMGVPTPCKRRKKYKYSSLGLWGASQVSKMLTSETYIGMWHYGKSIGKNGNGGKRGKGECITVPVPAIISDTTFEKAQKQKVYNARMSDRNTRRLYLLRGMIKCGCGSSFSGIDRKDRGYYVYRCNSITRPKAFAEKCSESRVRGPVIEDMAWQYVYGILTEPELPRDRLKEAQRVMMQSLTSKASNIEIIDGLIAEVEQEAEELASGLVHAKGIVLAKLQEQVERVSQRHSELTSKRKVLAGEINAAMVGITDDNITDIVRFARLVNKGLCNPTDIEKRRWFEYLGIEIEIRDKHATIKCYLPISPGEFDLTTS
ncbi:hypothetical protein TFLX_03722 [Thermoflexales bacterium]|nr:hypothetical protein TFLX_03722 [Thermoflexales bacterium]